MGSRGAERGARRHVPVRIGDRPLCTRAAGRRALMASRQRMTAQEFLRTERAEALARDLARALGGSLELLESPALVAAELPAAGNAFRLSLPASPPGR